MATIPTLSYLQSDENIIQQLITRPLPVDADLFDVADNCAALVTVLVESDDSVISSALCERLLQALHRLRELCDTDLPPNLIEQLIVGEKMTSCVPDCWHDTATQIDYALALTQAVKGDIACERCERAYWAAARYDLASGGVCEGAANCGALSAGRHC